METSSSLMEKARKFPLSQFNLLFSSLVVWLLLSAVGIGLRCFITCALDSCTEAARESTNFRGEETLGFSYYRIFPQLPVSRG